MSKYFTLSPERLNESNGRALGLELKRENVFYYIRTTNGNRYKGITFCVKDYNQAILVNDLISLVIEKNKHLKQDECLIKSL